MEARTKRRILFAAKLALSLAIMGVIFQKVLARENAESLWARLGDLSWGWLVVAALMQLSAIGCSVVRWDRLLVGQGIHAPKRHLVGSFMVGRFFGAFTPGGWTGLNGYRLYDIAKHTDKTARSAAVIGIEMILGQLAFGAVVIAGSIFGLRYLGLEGVLLVDGFFVVLIAAGITLLGRPQIFRVLAHRFPARIQGRIRTSVDAVCAYRGKTGLVTQAALLGMGTHAFNNLIYVATARALGVELGVGEVFFVSAMQIFATLLPASVNGVGLREAAAVALYARVGVPEGVAVLIPMVGFAVEMFISSFGGIVFMSRRHGYRPSIVVDEAEREDLAQPTAPAVPLAERPVPARGLAIGLGAGLLAGMLVGSAEAAVVLLSSKAAPDLGVIGYGATAYSLACGVAGAAVGLALAAWGRRSGRRAVPEPRAYARMTAGIVAAGWFALGAFRIRRDVFHEELAWKSVKGLAVLGGTAAVALVAFVALSAAIAAVVSWRPGRFMLRAWGSAAAVLAVVAVLLAVGLVGQPAVAAPHETRPALPPGARSVLVLVVDTLRADHLPAYGYAQGRTPNLDALVQDSIRFDQAFANASWTRPSFASILTGRYASSHRVMSKADALPGELVTLPEALAAGGYRTAGIVTNFNVAPFFNFHQGFDVYEYLEPEFVLWANDLDAKLLLVQSLRRGIETFRHRMGVVQPGTAYRDAETVNRAVLAEVDRMRGAPFFLFVGYMDPHDPYFEHPYSGSGYSRAANQTPRAEEAPRLRGLYDGEITYWDEELGKLVAALKQRGLYEDATIVVTSDHGEEFLDHGGFWHGTTLYDEQIRIPLVVKLPRREQAGRVVSHWVQSIDLMPTLLRLNGLPVPDGVQGGDLFEGTGEVFAEENHEGNVLASVRTRRGSAELKLITANERNPRGLPAMELFRVDQDPRERVDLAGEVPEVTRLAAARLDAQRDAAASGAVARQAVDSSADPAAEARLRALGYAGGN